MQATMRWVRIVARVGSVISVAVLLLFFLGGGLLDPHIAPPTPSEWIMILFFPVGVVIGMIKGWRHEKTGGWITIFSLIMFYILNLAVKGKLPSGLFFLLFSMPGFLFLLAAKLDETQSETEIQSQLQPQKVLQDH